MKNCEYLIAVPWSDVVYRCDNKDKCEYEIKTPWNKYCNWPKEEKEKE